MSKLVMSVIVLGAVVGMLVGCNTVEGAGRDIQSVGRALQNAAD